MMSLEAIACGTGVASLSVVFRKQQQLWQCVQVPPLSVSLQQVKKKSHRAARLTVLLATAASSSSSSSSSISRAQQLEVDLVSELGVNYEALRDKLAAGEWEAADAETRRLLCVLAGDPAVKRKWVYYSEVQFMPEADLKTVDGLWRAYSDNKFGYSVQRRIWKNADESWTAFFSKVSWTKRMADSRNDAYKKFPLEFMWDVADPTPPGHLPLTNALRGTQLLEKLLCHPAFEFADDEEKLLLPDTDSVFSQPPPPQQQQQQKQQQQQSTTPQRGVYGDNDLAVDYGF